MFVVPGYRSEGICLLRIRVSSASLVSNAAGDLYVVRSVLTGSTVMRPADLRLVSKPPSSSLASVQTNTAFVSAIPTFGKLLACLFHVAHYSPLLPVVFHSSLLDAKRLAQSRGLAKNWIALRLDRYFD